ncbi:MAG: hypothetical protein NVS9B14_20670 [Candidatus Acidiferrum sp.]
MDEADVWRIELDQLAQPQSGDTLLRRDSGKAGRSEDGTEE